MYLASKGTKYVLRKIIKDTVPKNLQNCIPAYFNYTYVHTYVATSYIAMYVFM